MHDEKRKVLNALSVPHTNSCCNSPFLKVFCKTNTDLGKIKLL